MENLNIYKSLNQFFKSINFEIENEIDHLDFNDDYIYIKQKNKNNFLKLKLFSYTTENSYYKIIGNNIKEINELKISLIKNIDDLKFLKSKVEETFLIHNYLVFNKKEESNHLVFRFHKISSQSPELTFINQKLGFFQFTVIYKNGIFEYFTNNNDKILYKNFESMLLNTYKKEIMNNHPDLSFDDSKEFLQIMQLIKY